MHKRCFQTVYQNQRVSFFWLAVNLKRLGLPIDLTVSALKIRAQKNRLINGKGVITEQEINQQTKDAFTKDYRGNGCDSEVVVPFCSQECPLNSRI